MELNEIGEFNYIDTIAERFGDLVKPPFTSYESMMEHFSNDPKWPQ